MAEVDTQPIVLGIDLGTTFSCVAAWVDDSMQILEEPIPSYVAFTQDRGILYGWEAKNQAPDNPKNTIYDAKRLIGRKFSDKVVQNELMQQNFGFGIEEGNEDTVLIVYTDEKGKVQKKRPFELSALVLKHIKRTAEEKLGRSVEKAVITVPAYFNDGQRKSTKDAGKLAGLNVLRIINEPTAAAMSYGLDMRQEQNVLIFDLGGGTFDVSLLNIDGGIFEVKATSGNTHLGGEDFDSSLVKWCCTKFQEQTGINAAGNAAALRSLRTYCEQAKCELSKKDATTISIQNLVENTNFEVEVTKELFINLNDALFRKVLVNVEEALLEGKTPKRQIDEIVLVGGSTRIPRVQEILVEYFEGKKLCKKVDPDKAVATGAAIQGAAMTRKDEAKFQDILLVDVLPLSVGVACGKKFDILMPRNSPIPRSVRETYTTTIDDQKSVSIEIYEGERIRCEDNNLLGQFELTMPENTRAGEPKIEVSFVINEDGVLKVKAKNIDTGENQEIICRNQQYTDEELMHLLEDSKVNEELDHQIHEKMEAQDGLRRFALAMKNTSGNPAFVQAAKDSLQWLNKHDELDKEAYEKKQLELEELCQAE